MAFAAIGLAIGAVGVVGSIANGQKANNLSQQANKIAIQQNDLQAARQKRDAIRQARIAYANSQNAAANNNASDSSASLGGLGSILSQAHDNLSFLDVYNKMSDQASILLGKAESARTAASTWGQISDVGFKVFGMGGGGKPSGGVSPDQVAAAGG